MLLITKILAGIDAVLLFSILICGLWIKSQGDKVVESNISFHSSLGIATVVVSAVLIVLVFFIKK